VGHSILLLRIRATARKAHKEPRLNTEAGDAALRNPVRHKPAAERSAVVAADGVRLGGRSSPKLLRIRPVEPNIHGKAERSDAVPNDPLGYYNFYVLPHEDLKFWNV